MRSVRQNWVIWVILVWSFAANECLSQGEGTENPIQSCDDATQAAEDFLRERVGKEIFEQSFEFTSCKFKDSPIKPLYSLRYGFSPPSAGSLVLEFGVLVWPHGGCHSTGQPLPRWAENPDFCTVKYSKEDAIELAAQLDLKGLPSEWGVVLKTRRDCDNLVWEVSTEWIKEPDRGSRDFVWVNAFTGEAVGPLSQNYIN